ncbi:MAG: hypothetical protein JW699_04920 [Chitinispirillaceae bacterium]|nr:hypothetical protein [Chitinispirillaceae bacterium]
MAGAGKVVRCFIPAFLIMAAAEVSAGTRVGSCMYRGGSELLNGRTVDVSDTMAATTGMVRAEGQYDTIYDTITIDSIIVTLNRIVPTLITVNGQLSTTRSGDTAFLFYNFIPLIGQITPVNIMIVYAVYQNNIKVKDTVVSISYNIHTQPFAAPVWNPVKDSFDIWTWDRDLVFRYNNSPIQFIADAMDSVELYFTFDSGTARYGYDNVSIDLYNSIAPIDSQSIQLTRRSDRVFSGKFKRELSVTANRGQFPPVLQYRGANDSVIAVFKNRENLISGKVRLPLDTLRVVMPLAAPSAVFYDKSPAKAIGETWKVFSDNGRVNVRFPSHGIHSVKVYSLAGHLIDSRTTNAVEESFRVPTGVYIVSVGQAGSRQETRKRVVAIGR